jgi:calcineurin-like phosphoesterase family protein
MRKPPWRRPNHEPDRFMVMLRIPDWKITRSMDALRDLIGDHDSVPPVPHITLYGRFTPREGISAGDLGGEIARVAAGTRSFAIRLDGWMELRGRSGYAVAHRVVPSGELARFQKALSGYLGPCAESPPEIDFGMRRIFHVSAAYGIGGRDLARIRSALDEATDEGALDGERCGPADFLRPEHTCLAAHRITLVRNGKAIAEYDLPSGRLFSRSGIFSPSLWKETLSLYRRKAGLELADAAIRDLPGPFVLSDLHLGHENIIRYCRRPFAGAEEMDRVLVANWNRTVSSGETIYFLGDLRYGPDRIPAAYWLSRLSGRTVLIRGNHDEDIPGASDQCSLEYGGLRFLLIHDPEKASPAPPGTWLIHGHAHNNDLEHYPYLSTRNRTVNVSVEVTRYSPVGLPELVRTIRDLPEGISLPIRPDPAQSSPWRERAL